MPDLVRAWQGGVAGSVSVGNLPSAGYPGPPLALGAVEYVEVDLAGHAVRQARAGILPEQPFAARIDFRRMLRHGAQPERMIRESALQIVFIEIGRGVDDRPLAVMALQLVHEHLHLLQNRGARRATLATRFVVPFHVDDRRQRAL